MHDRFSILPCRFLLITPTTLVQHVRSGCSIHKRQLLPRQRILPPLLKNRDQIRRTVNLHTRPLTRPPIAKVRATRSRIIVHALEPVETLQKLDTLRLGPTGVCDLQHGGWGRVGLSGFLQRRELLGERRDIRFGC